MPAATGLGSLSSVAAVRAPVVAVRGFEALYVILRIEVLCSLITLRFEATWLGLWPTAFPTFRQQGLVHGDDPCVSGGQLVGVVGVDVLGRTAPARRNHDDHLSHVSVRLGRRQRRRRGLVMLLAAAAA